MSKKITSIFLLVTLVISSLFHININTVEATGNDNLVEVISSEASTQYSDGNNAAKAFDHNSSTRWTSNISLNDSNRNNQWIKATLKDEVNLDHIDITWFTPWVNEYKIQVSNDGTTWTTATVSSVVTNGNETDAVGAVGKKVKVTSDSFENITARYIKIAMTNTSASYTYLSIIDVSIYSKSEETQISLQKPIVHGIGTYNSVDYMIDGTTNTSANRWTSYDSQYEFSLPKEVITKSSIEFKFDSIKNLTRFEVDWFNTPVTKYSISVSETDDGDFTKVVNAKDMPSPDQTEGDKFTHTSDTFTQNQMVKRVLLTFDDANSGAYLSICEVRAYAGKDAWKINLVDEKATATASSIQGDLLPNQAIDGNQNTRWASAFYEQPSYLLIDLHKNTSFDQMKIYQEASYGKSFNVEVSTDNVTYKKVYETSHGQTGENNIYFGDEINARYVKINFTEYGYYSAYSVWEVELFKNGANRMFEFVSNELSVPNKISTHFQLPTSIKNMDITWESHSSLLSIDDKGNVSVTTPETDTAVVLKAKLRYANQEKELTFNSTVLSYDNRQVNYEIYPVPQKMTLGESNVDLTETINVVLAETVKNDKSLKNRIKEVFKENGYQISYSNQTNENQTNLLIGVNGDGSVADTYANTNNISKNVFASTEEKRYDKHIVSLDANKNIIVLGQDADSTYYGLATLDLMFETAQTSDYFGIKSKRMTTVLIEDYADMQYRGVIEGFYGWPWSLEDRYSYIDFAKRYKLNYYAYGPKSDPYHLSKWNQDYPTESTITEEEKELGVMTQKDIRSLVEKCNEGHINFVWSIHPAMGDNKIDFNNSASITAGQAKIMKKYESMYNLGVRQFGLFVDDIDLTVAYNNRVHIANMVDGIQNSLYEKWGSAKANPTDSHAVKPLMFVPSHYFLTFGDSAQNEAAIKEFSRVHKDVIITFTGDGCWSSVKESDAKTFAQRVGRDPMFWWNYSTNDVMDDQLFTDKVDSYYSMNKDVTSLYGFISNPMNEAELSKISLFGIADYSWNVQDFDSSRDYDAYFKLDFEDQAIADAYKTIAVNLDKNGKSLSSEKELFNKVLNEYKTNGTCQAEDINKLKSYVTNLQNALEKIKGLKTSDNKSYQNLYDEMLPWLNKLSKMSEMTLELCDYLTNPSSTNQWNLFASHLLQLDAFGTDDDYAFVSLELNVSNAQSSTLRNVVRPNDPLLNFIKGMNNALKAKLEGSASNKAQIITNVEKYKTLTVNDNGNDNISLSLNNIQLDTNEFIGIAFNKILYKDLDMSVFTQQGLKVEYSLNGKEWSNSANSYAYIRLINKNDTSKIFTGNIEITKESVNVTASTNMNAYQTNTIEKVVDGDLSTKFWKAGDQAQGDYITLQYNNSINVNNLGFYFDSANGSLTDAPQKAYIQVSNDGNSWEKVGEIKIGDIQSLGNELYYVNIDNINKNVQYVRYYVQTPSGGQWFRLVEVITNEKLGKPQVTVDGKGISNINDGDLTTYSQLAENKELIYQVTDNINIEKISVKAMPEFKKQLNASVRIYASKTNYPYKNEWITLGDITKNTTEFNVSSYYNIQKISITNNSDDMNIFEITLNGTPYVDDTYLKTAVDQASAKIKELEDMKLDTYTTSSQKTFTDSLKDWKNKLSAYQSLEDVQNVLIGLNKCENNLVKKGDATELRKTYESASTKKEKDYTEASYKVLSTVLTKTKQLFNNLDDTDQNTIDSMLNELKEAINGLVVKGNLNYDAPTFDTNKPVENVTVGIKDIDTVIVIITDSMSQDIQEKINDILNEGKDVDTIITINTIDETTVNESIKNEIEKVKAYVEKENMKLVNFFDITIQIVADNAVVGNVAETNKPLTFQIMIPEELKKEGRTFKVVRIHGNEIKLLNTKEENGILTFESDQFSTYALTYTDEVQTSKPNNSIDTSDQSSLELYAEICMIALLGFFLVNRKKELQ